MSSRSDKTLGQIGKNVTLAATTKLRGVFCCRGNAGPATIQFDECGSESESPSLFVKIGFVS